MDAQPKLLAPADAARLTEFARACKAAARAVVLYPGGHPAINVTLARIVHVTSPAALAGPMRVTVLPDGLLVEDCAPPRPDAAIGELAALLHTHLIGEIVVHPGGDAEAWRQFLALLGRTPESVRTDGGIARIWTTMAGRHVELREIDYAEVLRERSAGEKAAWESVIANCLLGRSLNLDDAALQEMLRIATDEERLSELMTELETRAGADGGLTTKTMAIMRMLRGIVEAVSQREPDRLEPVLQNMATAVGRLTPDVILGLLSQRGEADDGPQLVNQVVSHMSDGTIAKFVARNVTAEDTALTRLAEAFHSLVRDGEERQRLLDLAKDDVADSVFGSTEDFESVWSAVSQKLLTSYSDKPFVSDAYAKELTLARTNAIEVEQTDDDPPERVSAWLSTVATSQLRALDLQLLLDLLRLEEDDTRWGDLMRPVVMLIDDLLLVGDFEAAEQLVAVIVSAGAGGATKDRRQQALTAIDVLAAGAMLRHIVSHLTTIEDEPFGHVRDMCVSLGEVLVRPLAEALSAEERTRPRQRLTEILLAFGAVGRRTVERLKSSPNAAVRRTAIHLMRQFVGSEALPDLTELLDDSEPEIQREAVVAIINIATDAAYRVIEQALNSGSATTRDAIMRALAAMRDERATPLLAYILDHVDHRGPTAPVYLRAIESLGALRDPKGVGPLKNALYKGEWWAPRRTRELRVAAAAALARTATPEAFAVLDEAEAQGSRGVRTAARSQAAARRQSRAGVA